MICDLNPVPGLAFIGVLNDVRTRFVHSQLESLYSIVRKFALVAWRTTKRRTWRKWRRELVTARV